MKKFSFLQKGFTLIELLIVIAVLGVLATAVLAAIDPVEQLARGRDSGRKNSVVSLGNAIQAYYTARAGTYPAAAGWDATLTSSGEMKVFPTQSAPNPVTVCTVPAGGTANMVGNFCYKLGGGTTPDFVVYAHVESKLEAGKGTCGGTLANTWFVYSSAAGRAGTYCNVAEPLPGLTAANLL